MSGFNGVCLAKEAKALGVSDPLQWLMDIQVEKVIAELDAKVVVDSINCSEVDGNYEFDQIIADCRALAQPHQFSFRSVKW